MRSFLFLATIFALFIVTIVFAYKPAMIEEQYARIKEPIEKHFEAQRAEAWRTAKEEAWKLWKANVQLPGDCSEPASSLRALECKNLMQIEVETFQNKWAEKVASGWKPEGMR
ncbi:MAG: hypothetical protein WA632_11600 [Gallionella sp.]